MPPLHKQQINKWKCLIFLNKCTTTTSHVKNYVTNSVMRSKQWVLTELSILKFSLLCVTVFWMRLLYDAFPAGLVQRSPFSIKQQIWSVGPRESSSPVLKPFIGKFNYTPQHSLSAVSNFIFQRKVRRNVYMTGMHTMIFSLLPLHRFSVWSQCKMYCT